MHFYKLRFLWTNFSIHSFTNRILRLTVMLTRNEVELLWWFCSIARALSVNNIVDPLKLLLLGFLFRSCSSYLSKKKKTKPLCLCRMKISRATFVRWDFRCKKNWYQLRFGVYYFLEILGLRFGPKCLFDVLVFITFW